LVALSVVCLSRVRSRKLGEIGLGAKFRHIFRSPSTNMTSDFAPEVAKYPNSNSKPKNSPIVRAYCLAPLAMQLVSVTRGVNPHRHTTHAPPICGSGMSCIRWGRRSSAEGADRVGCGEKGSPPSRRGLGGDYAPSPENVLTSEWKMVRFGAFWVLFLQTNFLQIVS